MEVSFRVGISHQAELGVCYETFKFCLGKVIRNNKEARTNVSWSTQKPNVLKRATLHSGKILCFPRARLQPIWQRKPFCQVDLQLALIPQESAYLASVHVVLFASERYSTPVRFLFFLIPLQEES